jgi:RES domain-containing protein
VTIPVWRIFKAKHSATAFTGAGARRYGGRWNNPGVAVVYTAQSAALAALEMLVHFQSSQLVPAYRNPAISFDASLVEALDRKRLPADWRSDPPPAGLRSIGDQWIKECRSAVLRVPSALIDTEFDYLLNPNHPQFRRIRFGKPKSFAFDSRLVR